jgi:hypothetical protein
MFVKAQLRLAVADKLLSFVFIFASILSLLAIFLVRFLFIFTWPTTKSLSEG